MSIIKLKGNKYKKFSNVVLDPLFIPSRILNFKRPKWSFLQRTVKNASKWKKFYNKAFVKRRHYGFKYNSYVRNRRPFGGCGQVKVIKQRFKAAFRTLKKFHLSYKRDKRYTSFELGFFNKYNTEIAYNNLVRKWIDGFKGTPTRFAKKKKLTFKKRNFITLKKKKVHVKSVSSKPVLKGKTTNGKPCQKKKKYRINVLNVVGYSKYKEKLGTQKSVKKTKWVPEFMKKKILNKKSHLFLRLDGPSMGRKFETFYESPYKRRRKRLKTLAAIFGTNSFKVSNRFKGCTKLASYANLVARPLYKLEHLLFYLRYYSTRLEIRKEFRAGFILVNDRVVGCNYELKEGDVVTFDLNHLPKIAAGLKRHFGFRPKLLPFLEIDPVFGTIIVVKSYNKLSMDDYKLFVNKSLRGRFDYARVFNSDF